MLLFKKKKKGTAVIGGGGGVVSWYLAGGSPTPLAAYRPIGAASYAASKVNLVTPGTYDAVDGANVPSWSAARGWYSDDETVQRYLTSTLACAAGMTLIAGFRSATGTQCVVGATTQLAVSPKFTGLLRAWYGTTAYTQASATNAVICNAAGKIYVDGVYKSTAVGATFGANINPFGDSGRLGVFDVIAVAVYATELSQAQVTAVTAAINALNP